MNSKWKSLFKYVYMCILAILLLNDKFYVKQIVKALNELIIRNFQ